MSVWKTMLNWWTRHATILALPVFLGVVLLTYWRPQIPGEWLCQPNEACAREWVSALSGWAAAVAAAITVRVIQTQINKAERQHREMLRHQSREAINLARRTSDLCNRLEVNADGLRRAMENSAKTGMFWENHKNYLRYMNEVVTLIESKLFDEFEAKIGNDRSAQIENTRKYILHGADRLKSKPEIGSRLPPVTEFTNPLEAVLKFANDCQRRATEFISAFE